MRIRLFQAFASNNSGSYTIVGRFDDVEQSRLIAQRFADCCSQHAAWVSDESLPGPSPLERLAAEIGLDEPIARDDDDWPAYGDAPRVETCGAQLILHAPYTITISRVFGAYIYARGGRVDVEHDHSHEPLIAQFEFGMRDLRWGDPRRETRIRQCFEELLPLVQRAGRSRAEPGREHIPPAVYSGFFRARRLSAVFEDLLEGVALVRDVAARWSIEVSVRIVEAAEGVGDPLGAYREQTLRDCRATVLVLDDGRDVDAAAAVVARLSREDPAAARERFRSMPFEASRAGELTPALEAVEALRALGCAAELALRFEDPP